MTKDFLNILASTASQLLNITSLCLPSLIYPRLIIVYFKMINEI